MSISIASIESRISDLKKSVEQSLANHNFLTGMLNEAVSFLGIATKVAETVIPASPVAAGLEAADSVANEVQSAVNSLLPSEETPAS